MSAGQAGPGRYDQDRYYAGIPMISYDLIKELVLAVWLIGVSCWGCRSRCPRRTNRRSRSQPGRQPTRSTS